MASQVKNLAVKAVATADLYDCKAIVDALIARVSDLTGFAWELEDASSQLAKDIEAFERKENPPLCAQCSGSGEGQHEGTTCRSCHGTGTEAREAA